MSKASTTPSPRSSPNLLDAGNLEFNSSAYPSEGENIPRSCSTVRTLNPTNLRHLAQPVTNKPSLFAVIIGIDQYVNCQKLSGAVADAKAMADYLKKLRGVPEDRVRVLLDSQATRAEIIQAFEDITTNERIRRGDPIVIFFAGHGKELPKKRVWSTQQEIQSLIPYDYCESEGKRIYPIPDRTIASLLNEITREKGNNITVIFDCCHAAGAARDDSQSLVPRTVNIKTDIPDDLDNHIWGRRAAFTPQGFAHSDIRSHVLLAACGEKEFAYERDGRGQFTRALLDVLYNRGDDIHLTYAQLFDGIQLEKQSPHCIGIHQHRMLFDARVPAGKHVRHHVQMNSEDACVIDAGLAHGVSYGAEFTFYDSQRQTLRTTVVEDATAVIEDFRTTITAPLDLPRGSDVFAKLTRVPMGQVPLYVGSGNLSAVPQQTPGQVASTGTNLPKLKLVQEKEGAKLGVSVGSDDRIAFTILDEEVKRFELTELSETSTLDKLDYILGAAAHYYWYLHLKNDKNSTLAKSGLAIEFYHLYRPLADLGVPMFERPFLKPETPLCREGPTPGSKLVDLEVDPIAFYGIEIRNKSPRDLYLNVLLFNNTTLSIVPCYIQSTAGRPDAPLKKEGTFTIGYGPGDTSPLEFGLEDDQSMDVSHLKIFISTQPIDLTDIVQMSPFAGVDAMPMVGARTTRTGGKGPFSQPSSTKSGPRKGSPVDIWFTVELPIVQRRKPEA